MSGFSPQCRDLEVYSKGDPPLSGISQVAHSISQAKNTHPFGREELKLNMGKAKGGLFLWFGQVRDVPGFSSKN